MAARQRTVWLKGSGRPTITGAGHCDDRRALYQAESVRLAGPEAIRLLRVIHTDTGIVFRLFATSTGTAPPRYTALSYAWRSPLRRTKHVDYSKDIWHAITCQTYDEHVGWQEHSIYVLQNLFLALTRITSLRSDVRDLWVDDLCIDQGELKERKEQVERMGSIFQQAERTVAWLGESDEASEQAMPLIRELYKFALQRIDIHPPHHFVCQLEGWQYATGVSYNYWRSMALFFQRSWFSRAWVVQEVILTMEKSQSQSRTTNTDEHLPETQENDMNSWISQTGNSRFLILCGEQTLNWAELTSVPDVLITRGFGNYLDDGSLCENEDGQHEVSLSLGCPAKLASAAKDLYRTCSLLRYLIRARDFDSSDPRDKVYCILSVAKTNLGVTTVADYTLSATHTYIAIAQEVLIKQADAERLHMLHHVESRRAPAHQDLPSWVPDWSIAGNFGLAITGYKRYAAAGSLQIVQPRFTTNGMTLVLKGIQIATIAKSGETKKEVQQAKLLHFPGWLTLIESLYERAITSNTCSTLEVFEILWRTLIRDTDRDCQSPADDAKWPLGLSFVYWIYEMARRNTQRGNPVVDPSWAPQAEMRTTSIDETKSLLDLLCILHSDSKPYLRDSLQRMCASNPRTRLYLDTPISRLNVTVLPSACSDAPPSKESPFGEQSSKTVHQHFDLCYSYRVVLRLFVTDIGHLGLGTDALLPNDTLWLVPGSRVPLILRPVPGSYDERGNSRDRLVGGAYVHGIMQGEMLNHPVCAPLHDEQSASWVEIV